MSCNVAHEVSTSKFIILADMKKKKNKNFFFLLQTDGRRQFICGKKKKYKKQEKKCVYMFHFPQTFSGVTELRAEERAFSVGALELF